MLLRYGAHFSSFALLYCITFFPFGQRVSKAEDTEWAGVLPPQTGGREGQPHQPLVNLCSLCCLLSSSSPQAHSRKAEGTSHQGGSCPGGHLSLSLTTPHSSRPRLETPSPPALTVLTSSDPLKLSLDEPSSQKPFLPTHSPASNPQVPMTPSPALPTLMGQPRSSPWVQALPDGNLSNQQRLAQGTSMPRPPAFPARPFLVLRPLPPLATVRSLLLAEWAEGGNSCVPVPSPPAPAILHHSGSGN